VKAIKTNNINMPARKTANKTKAKSYIKYHNDGSIWARGKMADDNPTGYWEWFRKDGTIMRSGYFENGKQTGQWTTYDKKGKVYKITQMK
jgi:antitoxin component YwqK of YwqJK toxin-antitoxin module